MTIQQPSAIYPHILFTRLLTRFQLMPQSTRRGGIKKRFRALKYALENAPARTFHGANMGIDTKNYYNPEYEFTFAAHNPSVREPERREGYNPRKPWLFTLQAISPSQTAPAPAGYVSHADPRIRNYAIMSGRTSSSPRS